MSQKILNIETLEAWQEIDSLGWQKLVREILDIFFQTSQQQYESLKHAFVQKDWEMVKSTAHTLKSTCGNVGAEYSHWILNEIENKALPEPAAAVELMNKLQPIYEQTIIYLSDYHKKLQAAVA
jgi:two-component system sensor histidine kinase/response regulator